MGILLHPLEAILCVLQNLVLSILAVIIMAFNALIVGLADFLVGVASLLPEMPDPPEITDIPHFSQVVGFAAWLFPLGTLLVVATTVFALWVGVQVVEIALRWGKVIE